MKKLRNMLFVAACFACGVVAAASEWNIRTDDGTTIRVTRPSLAIDPDNNTHLCFFDPKSGRVKYGMLIDDTWHVEVVDPTKKPVRDLSLVLGPNGRPHIAYLQDAVHGGDIAKHAQKVDQGWDVEEIADSNNYFFRYLSMDVDSKGGAHICYVASPRWYAAPRTQHLRYAHRNRFGWENAVIRTHRGYAETTGSKICVTSQDTPIIAFVEGHGDAQPVTDMQDLNSIMDMRSLVIARADSPNDWDFEVVGTTNSCDRYLHLAMALDSRDRPHMVYTLNGLTYTKWTGEKWESEVIDKEAVEYSSTFIVLDSSDSPHISFTTGGGPIMVKYATLSGIEWVTARQDESGGRHAVIALDWNEAAHIVYEDRPEFFLRYAAIRNAITMKRPAVFMRMEGKTCVLEWETQKDVDYRIQFSEDLKTWSEFGPVVRSKDGRVIRRSLLESEHFPDREPTKLFFRIVLSGTP